MKDLVQVEDQIGYWKDKRCSNFVVLANFGVRMLKHVAAPKELPKETGFLVVTQRKYKKSGSGSSELLKGYVKLYNHRYLCL